MSLGDDGDDGVRMDIGIPVEKAPADGAGCHAGSAAMRDAAAAAGNSDVLDRYASGFACGAPRACSRAPRAACTG